MLDGSTSAPGGIDGNGLQVALQLADIAAISGYSFAVSCVLLLIMKYVPGLHLRISDEAEARGLDHDQFFEEQIGDWSLLHERGHGYGDDAEKRNTNTVVAPVSSDGGRE